MAFPTAINSGMLGDSPDADVEGLGHDPGMAIDSLVMATARDLVSCDRPDTATTGAVHATLIGLGQ